MKSRLIYVFPSGTARNYTPVRPPQKPHNLRAQTNQSHKSLAKAQRAFLCKINIIDNFIFKYK